MITVLVLKISHRSLCHVECMTTKAAEKVSCLRFCSEKPQNKAKDFNIAWGLSDEVSEWNDFSFVLKVQCKYTSNFENHAQVQVKLGTFNSRRTYLWLKNYEFYEENIGASTLDSLQCASGSAILTSSKWSSWIHIHALWRIYTTHFGHDTTNELCPILMWQARDHR